MVTIPKRSIGQHECTHSASSRYMMWKYCDMIANIMASLVFRCIKLLSEYHSRPQSVIHLSTQWAKSCWHSCASMNVIWVPKVINLNELHFLISPLSLAEAFEGSLLPCQSLFQPLAFGRKPLTAKNHCQITGAEIEVAISNLTVIYYFFLFFLLLKALSVCLRISKAKRRSGSLGTENGEGDRKLSVCSHYLFLARDLVYSGVTMTTAAAQFVTINV